MSGEARPKLRRRLHRALERQRALFLAAPDLRVDLPRLDPALADREAQRAAEQLRVGELLPRAALAVVVEHVHGVAPELLVEPVRHLARLFARLPERDELDVEGRHGARPGDALLVSELLDRRGDDAGRADAVGAHPD